MSAEMQQYAVPVDGQHLGWAKSAYAANGVPIVQIVQLPGGGYAIVIMAPAGGPVPDWRGMPTYKRPPFWQRIDRTWVMIAVNLVAIAALGWLLVNSAPAAVASIVPDLPTFAMPEIVMPEWAPKIELPDIGGAVQDATDKAMAPVREAIDTATRVAMGVMTLALGLVVLWLLFTFRGTLGGIAGGFAGAVRKVRK